MEKVTAKIQDKTPECKLARNVLSRAVMDYAGVCSSDSFTSIKILKDDARYFIHESKDLEHWCDMADISESQVREVAVNLTQALKDGKLKGKLIQPLVNKVFDRL